MYVKCCVNSCLHATNSSFASWNFLEFLFLNIFNLHLVEPVDVEPVHVEGRLYPFLNWAFRPQ